MGLSCGAKCIKYLLFAFNFIFWAVGAIIMGVGIWFLADPNALHMLHVATVDTSDSLIKAAAITLVVVGVLVFVVGALGCCGACRESSGCLLAFASIIGVLLVGQLIAAILAGAFYSQILKSMENTMNKTVYVTYGDAAHTAITTSWDYMQIELVCCGASGPSDWLNSKWHANQTQPPVPNTCCTLVSNTVDNPVPKNATACYMAALDTSVDRRSDYVHVQGCVVAMEDWIKHHIGILIGIAIGLLFVQVIGIILACMLRKHINNAYETV